MAGGHSHDAYKLYLIWIDERNEWIGVWHHEWSEGDFSIDESETGPYALDDYCRDLLSRAYELAKEKLHGDISKISPSELEEIAKTSN